MATNNEGYDLTAELNYNQNPEQIIPHGGMTKAEVWLQWKWFYTYIGTRITNKNDINLNDDQAKITLANPTEEIYGSQVTQKLIDGFNNTSPWVKQYNKLPISKENIIKVQEFYKLTDPNVQIDEGRIGTQTSKMPYPSFFILVTLDASTGAETTGTVFLKNIPELYKEFQRLRPNEYGPGRQTSFETPLSDDTFYPSIWGFKPLALTRKEKLNITSTKLKNQAFPPTTQVIATLNKLLQDPGFTPLQLKKGFTKAIAPGSFVYYYFNNDPVGDNLSGRWETALTYWPQVSNPTPTPSEVNKTSTIEKVKTKISSETTKITNQLTPK